MSVTKVTDNMRNVTQVDAAKITTGTIPDARLPSTLPASSGANLTSLNASNLGSGTVATARLGSGTASSSTFLRGDSTYAPAGGGAWNYIATATASNSASLVFSSNIDSTYSVYVFILKNVDVATNEKEFWMGISTDAGSSYIGSGLSEVVTGKDAGGTDRGRGSTGGAYYRLCDNNNTSAVVSSGVCGQLFLFDPSNASMASAIKWSLGYRGSQGAEYITNQEGFGMNYATGDIDAVKFYAETGNLTSGEIRMYGIADS